jgi:hypothetical protein
VGARLGRVCQHVRRTHPDGAAVLRAHLAVVWRSESAAGMAEGLSSMVAAPALGIGLELSNVSHQFDLHGVPLPVLDRISFSLESGEFVALLGPSGLRLVDPSSIGRGTRCTLDRPDLGGWAFDYRRRPTSRSRISGSDALSVAHCLEKHGAWFGSVGASTKESRSSGQSSQSGGTL